MPRRPSSFVKYARNAFSIVGGILLEVVFILWCIVVILGAASVGIFLWHLVS